MTFKPGRPLTKRVHPSAFVFVSACALMALPACGDDGVTTACEEMPVVTPEDPHEDLSDAEEVQDWWQDAARDGCATAPIGDGAATGAAGARN